MGGEKERNNKSVCLISDESVLRREHKSMSGL